MKMRKLFYQNPFSRMFHNHRKMKYTTSTNNNILVEKLGNITTIGINRPDKRNCIDTKTSEMMRSAIESFESDDNSYVAVLYGIGGNFCSGIDLEELASLKEQEMEDSSRNGLLGLPRFVKKPMVAAINGYAVGEGFELALLCDLRVMEENALLGLYSRRFGIPLMDGATVRLQAIVGLTRALDLILTGRSINAKEAFEWGIVNRVVACGTGLGQAINLASSLVKFPQDSLRVDREATYQAAYSGLYDDLLLQEQKNSKGVFLKNAVEGTRKFLSGIGKHGKFFHIKAKVIEQWEKEFQDDDDVIKKPKSKL